MWHFWSESVFLFFPNYVYSPPHSGSVSSKILDPGFALLKVIFFSRLVNLLASPSTILLSALSLIWNNSSPPSTGAFSLPLDPSRYVQNHPPVRVRRDCPFNLSKQSPHARPPRGALELGNTKPSASGRIYLPLLNKWLSPLSLVP